jgi:hypothetical protein
VQRPDWIAAGGRHGDELACCARHMNEIRSDIVGKAAGFVADAAMLLRPFRG